MKISAARVPALAVASATLIAASLAAQTPPQTSFTLTLPNYNTIPIGQVGGLEGGAYIARTNDASSNWYNPAGLALAKTSSVSSSAGTYQLLSLIPKDLQSEDSGGSTQQVPALVGIVIKKPFGDDRYTGGIAVVRTNSWSQQTDAQIDELESIPGRLLTYSADSEFRRVEASLALAYADGGPWRFGANLSGSNTSLRAVGSVSDLLTEPTGLEAIQTSRRINGSSTQIRAAAGVQYQMTPQILLGGVVRSPGVTLFRSGDYSFDGQVSAGGESASITFFDPDVRFDYKLPFQVGMGAAMALDRFELELDATFSTGNSSYDFLRSEKQSTFIVDNGLGGPPVVTRLPVAAVQAETDAIVNIAFGGYYALTENKVWKLHFGFNTDFSPVGDNDEFFTKVDLYSFALGISGETRHFIASLGANYSFGNANDAPLAELLDSDISVKAIAIIYSLAYRF